MTDPLLTRLAQIVGASALLTSPEQTSPYLTDWRGRYCGRARCVVKPATTQEVAAVVRACVEHATPIVPQGGNTGLCGGATPDASGAQVVVNLSRMARIRAIDTDNNTITVEAGCVLETVQRAAHDAQRLFPLALAAQGSCEIGGNLSTNAGGVNVLRYGNARELALGLEVVLPDGRVWDGLRGLRKDNTGYDLRDLFIGAEGTLGIITAAVLKLFPHPRADATAWVAVRDPLAAAQMLDQLRALCGDRVTGFEFIGCAALDLVLKHIPGSQDPLAGRHAWYVLVELTDTLPGSHLVAVLQDYLAQAIEEGVCADAAIAQTIAQRQAFWHLRENISEAQRIAGISIKHDVAVPVSRIAEFLQRAEGELRAAFRDVRIVAFGHMGDGNLHYNLSKPDATDNSAFIAKTAEANRIVHDLVAALGGTISAEHGLGQLKRNEILRYKSAVEIDLMRKLKKALDPGNLMNPGKVLPD